MKRQQVYTGMLLVLLMAPVPALALSGVMELETANVSQNTVANASAGYEIPPDHWSYKLVSRLAPMAGINPKDSQIDLDGVHPVSRTGMAVLVSDLSGRINSQSMKTPMDARDQAQFDILRDEFKNELQVLNARIAKVENTVQYLSEQVKKEADNEKSAVHMASRLGPASVYGALQVWDTIPFSDRLTERNFRIRRAEVGIRGDLSDKWHYAILIDPARSTNLLKDAMIDYSLNRHLSLRAGQFKPGITYEGLLSSGRIDLIERSQIGQFGDVREQGAAMIGTWKYMDYQLGIYNGSGENTRDENRRLGYGGRVTIRPLLDVLRDRTGGHLELGSSFFQGQTGPKDDIQQRDRLGFEVRYIWSKLMLSSEYLAFQNPGVTRGSGWYVQGAYRLTPKWQLVARYDVLDPDHAVAHNNRQQYVAGVNYFWEQYNVRLSLNYLYILDRQHVNDGSAIQILAQHVF